MAEDREAGYRIILTGHSLGGGVAAVLLWLLRHGTCGEGAAAEVEMSGGWEWTKRCFRCLVDYRDFNLIFIYLYIYINL